MAIIYLLSKLPIFGRLPNFHERSFMDVPKTVVPQKLSVIRHNNGTAGDDLAANQDIGLNPSGALVHGWKVAPGVRKMEINMMP